MRAVFLDHDARREPKTDRFCIKCQKDIKQDQPARVVMLRVSDMYVLHPDDATDDCERYLVGLDCAKKIGLEFSRPENTDKG